MLFIKYIDSTYIYINYIYINYNAPARARGDVNE